MQALLPFFFVGLLVFTEPLLAADENAPSFMTTRGKLLVSEDFSKPLAPLTGNPDNFASGYSGWRYNLAPRAGAWTLADGAFHGATNAEAHHPAAATYGLEYRDATIECEMRMDEVPLGGTMGNYMQIRTTGLKGYVCSTSIDNNGFRIQKDDFTGGGKHTQQDKSDDGPDVRVPLGSFKTPVKFGEWQKIVFEILGEEMTVTMNGHSLTGTHPLIASDKHSVMFDFGAAGSVRNFKVWEALPNPDWTKTRTVIQEGMIAFPLR